MTQGGAGHLDSDSVLLPAGLLCGFIAGVAWGRHAARARRAFLPRGRPGRGDKTSTHRRGRRPRPGPPPITRRPSTAAQSSSSSRSEFRRRAPAPQIQGRRLNANFCPPRGPTIASPTSVSTRSAPKATRACSPEWRDYYSRTTERHLLISNWPSRRSSRSDFSRGAHPSRVHVERLNSSVRDRRRVAGAGWSGLRRPLSVPLRGLGERARARRRRWEIAQHLLQPGSPLVDRPSLREARRGGHRPRPDQSRHRAPHRLSGCVLKQSRTR